MWSFVCAIIVIIVYLEWFLELYHYRLFMFIASLRLIAIPHLDKSICKYE